MRKRGRYFQDKQRALPVINAKDWRKFSTWWKRCKRRWAYFLLVRIDPLIARWQYRKMRK